MGAVCRHASHAHAAPSPCTPSLPHWVGSAAALSSARIGVVVKVIGHGPVTGVPPNAHPPKKKYVFCYYLVT